MRTRRMLMMLAVVAMVMSVMAPAWAIGVGNGPDGEAQTVNSPDTPDGFNDAHGPICGALGGCVHNQGTEQAADNAVNNPALLSPFGNVGAWNGYFQSAGKSQSESNNGVCGIWATDAEATAAGEEGAPTCEDS